METLLGVACLVALALTCLLAAGDAAGRDEMPGAGLALLGMALVVGWLAAGAVMHAVGA